MVKTPRHTTNPETGAVLPYHIYSSGIPCQEALKAGVGRNPNSGCSESTDTRTALLNTTHHSVQDYALSRDEDDIHRWEDEGGALGVEPSLVLPDASLGLEATGDAPRSAQKTTEGALL